MASDKRLDQVKLVNSAESVLVVNGDQVEKATLAGFANSMGSSVPLQQTSEQVSITGLYARTSDGKMVELTSDSVASVMAGLMGTNKLFPFMLKGYAGNVDERMEDGYYAYHASHGSSGAPTGKWLGTFLQMSAPEYGNGGNPISQTFYYWNEYEFEIYSRSKWGDTWSAWQRIDNFGYNTLAELSSGVAEQITRATTGTIGSYVLGWVRIAKWNTTGYYDGIAATITLRGVWGDNPAGTGAMKFDVAVSYPNNFKIGNVVGVNKFTRARLVVEDGATWLDVYAGNAGGGVIVNIQNYGFGPVTFSLKQVSGDASDGVPLYNN